MMLSKLMMTNRGLLACLLLTMCASQIGTHADDKASSLKDARRRYSVMVIVPETILQLTVPDPAVETEIKRQLIKAGYRVMDSAREKEVRARLVAKVRDRKAAESIALKEKADVLIWGEAISERLRVAPAGLISYQARVEINATLLHTGEQVSSASKTRAAVDLGDATTAKKALEVTARLLGPELIADLDKVAHRTSRTITLTVRGFHSRTGAGRFSDLLEKLDGVRRVTQRSYNEGVAEIEIEVTGSQADKIGQLIEANDGFKDLRIKITESTATEIQILVDPP